MKASLVFLVCIIAAVQAGFLQQQHHHQPVVYTSVGSVGSIGHGHGGVGLYPSYGHGVGISTYSSVPYYGGHYGGHGHGGGYVVPATYSSYPVYGGYSSGGWAKK